MAEPGSGSGQVPGRTIDGPQQEGAERGLTFTLLVQGDVAAFFVADLGAVVRRHFCFLKCLPRVRPFYTVKCNSSPGVLKVLAELGLGFSCANKVSPCPPLAHCPSLPTQHTHGWAAAGGPPSPPTGEAGVACSWPLPSGKGHPLGRRLRDEGGQNRHGSSKLESCVSLGRWVTFSMEIFKLLGLE